MNSFIKLLTEIRGGEAVEGWSQNLRELVEAVRETGKRGKISISIDVTPANKGDGSTVLLTESSKTSIPVPTTGATVFFTTEENELSRRDPRQPELTGLTAVPDKKSEAAGE